MHRQFATFVLALCGQFALAEPVLITAAKTVGPTDTTITPTAGGSPVSLVDAEITVRGATLTINGRHTIKSLVVERNASNVEGVVTHGAAFQFDYSGGTGTDIVYGMHVTTLGDVFVQGQESSLKASRIDVSGRGFGPLQGPGAGSSTCCVNGGGAGHGGLGGASSSGIAGGKSYGSALEPVDLGSGGGNATDYGYIPGTGGGAARLIVGGTLTVNGSISANAVAGSTSGRAGGGSGGSVWITCGTLQGTGTISANGSSISSGGGGGGAGGRIAVYFDTSSFTGGITAYGAIGAIRGGAGTIVTWASADAQPDVVISDTGTGGRTPLALFGTQVGVLTVSGGAELVIDSPLSVLNCAVTGNSTRVSHTEKSVAGLVLQVAESLTIGPGASVYVSGRGFGPLQGPGAGSSTCCVNGGGAGHGGLGGASSSGIAGGKSYGSALEPVDLGSGGGNATDYGYIPGTGGGAARLIVGGTLTVNGSISANAVAGSTSGRAGGGSGGSVWITCGTLQGTGTISANGSSISSGGGGGGAGGRIAVYSCDIEMPTTQLTVLGGTGGDNGENGTVYYGSSSIDITTQPGPKTYLGGELVSLVVEATGDGPLTYQWYYEGTPIVDDEHIGGAMTSTLTFDPITCDDAGDYYCLIRDACGAFPTDTASISVAAPADYDGSGFVDTDDFTAFVIDFELGIDKADFDGTGFVDTDDFTAFVLAFEAGC